MPQLTDTRLTDASVRSAKPKADRYDLFDAQLRGFGVRVAPSGTKTWHVMRRVNGRMTRRTLGRYPALSLADARVNAQPSLATMARGGALERFASMRLRDDAE